MREQWADPAQRALIVESLAERGIDFQELAEATGQPEADPFDLLCHVAFNAPLRTRRERADRLRRDQKDFFDRYGPEAKAILEELLENMPSMAPAQFALPDVLKVPPISDHGNVIEIADLLRRPGPAPRSGRSSCKLCSMPHKEMHNLWLDTYQNRLSPFTTAQSLASLIKSARDIMRKDKGLNGDLDRLPMLTWIMFLKFLDDMEQEREMEAAMAGKRFRPAIEPPYRWRDWAAKEDGITGDELIAFINQDEAVRPDGDQRPRPVRLSARPPEQQRRRPPGRHRHGSSAASSTAWSAATCSAT